MMMMMIMITIIMTLKVQFEFWGFGFFFFFLNNLSTAPSPTRSLKWPGRNRVQITCNTSGAYHVQHVVCHVLRRDSSAIKFERVEIAFILSHYRWLKPLTDEGHEGRKGFGS